MQSASRFPASDFDEWAETYDRDVAVQDTFPFAGYERALATVVQWAAPQRGMAVLDVGTGTGNLALRFAKAGCELWCTDFSPAMLARAREKLPAARLMLHDLEAHWPPELDRRFDRIVSAYVFHHFTLRRKIELVKDLALQHLAPAGKLILADLSFPDGARLRAFARSVGEQWEDEEYWIADESMHAIADAGLKVEYVQVSECAGVYCIESHRDVHSPN
jgi:putative AdoMet-dependent methyltransferase